MAGYVASKVLTDGTHDICLIVLELSQDGTLMLSIVDIAILTKGIDLSFSSAH